MPHPPLIKKEKKKNDIMVDEACQLISKDVPKVDANMQRCISKKLNTSQNKIDHPPPQKKKKKHNAKNSNSIRHPHPSKPM